MAALYQTKNPFAGTFLQGLFSARPEPADLATPLGAFGSGWLLKDGNFVSLFGDETHTYLAKKLLGTKGLSAEGSEQLLKQGAIRVRPSASAALRGYQVGKLTPEAASKIEGDLLELPRPTTIRLDEGTRINSMLGKSWTIPWSVFENSGFDLMKAVRNMPKVK
jgi:hypothetical protein